MTQNDGRKVKGWLPKLTFTQPKQVVQVINERPKRFYTHSCKGKNFQPKVYENETTGEIWPDQPVICSA